MLTPTVALLVIAILFWKGQLTSAECVMPAESKTRIFDSLVHYQGNKVPFNPANGSWMGSDVEFSAPAIKKLSKNAFITKDSSFIITLKLSGKQIERIDEGAFISLTCLHRLFLDGNNITQLTRHVFQGLEALDELDLSSNGVEVLKDLTFADLHALKTLDLSNNRIKTAEVLAFTNLTQLERLNLERNDMGKVPDELFEPLSSLKKLVLSWNNLWNVQPEKWIGLNALQSLDLAGNRLAHFDPGYNFSFSGLKSLNLSSNSLTVLNVAEMRIHLPGIELLDLNDNPWFCGPLLDIVKEFHDSHIRLVQNKVPSVGTAEMSCSESTTSTTEASTTRRQDDLERYVEKKIRDNNAEIKNSIESLRTLVIFLFGLLCVLVVFELLYRTDVCRLLVRRVKGRDLVLIDDSTDLENFRLLRR